MQHFCSTICVNWFSSSTPSPICGRAFSLKQQKRLTHSPCVIIFRITFPLSILCYYASSGVLGDVELLLPSPKTTNTVSAFSCVAVPLRENRVALLGNLSFVSRIGQELAQKLLRSSDAHMISALYTSRERLRAYILTTQQGGVFREYLTDAALSVGVSYRQAQRIMQSLCSLGVLQKVDSGFQILDMPRLRALSCQGEATA